jgi:hypothetical protein
MNGVIYRLITVILGHNSIGFHSKNRGLSWVEIGFETLNVIIAWSLTLQQWTGKRCDFKFIICGFTNTSLVI